MRLQQSLHCSRSIFGGGSSEDGGVQMRKEEAYTGVEAGGGIRRGRGGKKAANQAEGLRTIARSPKEG